MATLIQAEQLSRYFGDHCAVREVDFSVARGEVLGFLGPNGAGKTTTMQMLSGNLAPSAGQILINGIDLLDRPREAKSQLGYLPDIPPVYRELTVQEYLEYCAALHRIPRPARYHAIEKSKRRCGLESVAGRLIGNLSKGFQQHIGIAQAILHNPQIIILDEPTVGLDPIQIREIRALIRELGSEHGIILSTHILPEVQESCTHVQIIDQGSLVLKETIAGLERHLNTAALTIRTRDPFDFRRLQSLPRIDNIEIISPEYCRIHHDLENNPAAGIAETIIASGAGLLALVPEKKTMEEIFLALTSRQEAEEPCA